MSFQFDKLLINNWKQFEAIDINFHPKLTILTGSNGAGKTTLVKILARNFGWNFSEIATPFKKENGDFSYLTRVTSKLKNFFSLPLRLFEAAASNGPVIGSLSYSNGQKASLQVPLESGPSYQIQISNQQQVEGIHIPSHRPQFFYQQVSQIPTRARTASEAFQQVQSNSMNFSISGGGSAIAYQIKESLISWALFGFGNQIIAANDIAKENFLGFQKILRIVLPISLGFQEFSIRNSDVVLVCSTGEFLIDACSGGITALIDLSWQIFNFKPSGSPFSVIIDEAENHLHASMQRSLLPSLIEAFPEVQFIVTTHSPLIIGSVKESNVYALTYTDGRVNSTQLDIENKASSATEILVDVLGLDATMPIWAAKELDEIVTRNSRDGFSEAAVKSLRNDLKSRGLEHLYPSALDAFIKKNFGG
ncbi:MAG: hypothetical protein EOP04_07980 [Proteobacteria bacterium]|nr:MAG: hypothetical protein EOP04_07980 [Pseudomonadota bacterium]